MHNAECRLEQGKMGENAHISIAGCISSLPHCTGRVDLGGGWRNMYNALGAMLFTWWNALGKSAGTLQGNGLVQRRGRGGR